MGDVASDSLCRVEQADTHAMMAFGLGHTTPDEVAGTGDLLGRIMPGGVELVDNIEPERVQLIFRPTRAGVRPTRARMARWQSDEQLSYACARACARLVGWSRTAHWDRLAKDRETIPAARRACLRARDSFSRWARVDDLTDRTLDAVALAIAMPDGTFDPEDALLHPEEYAEMFVLEVPHVRRRARLMLGHGAHDSGLRPATSARRSTG